MWAKFLHIPVYFYWIEINSFFLLPINIVYFILHPGNIRALLVNSKNPSDKTYIFSQTNNQGSGWQQGSADIGQLAAGYKVSFFYQAMHFSKMSN